MQLHNDISLQYTENIEELLSNDNRKIMKFCIDSGKTHDNNKKYVSVTIMKNKREEILKQKRRIQREIFRTSDFTTDSNA